TLATTTVVGSLTASGSSIALAGTVSAGSAVLTSTVGDITDSGVDNIQVTGTTTLNSTGDVILDNAGNDFGGAVSTQAANATLVDANDLTLDTTTVVGSLTATASDSITDGTDGDLAITGNASFDANSIVLGDDAGNDTNFGSLTLNGGTAIISEDSSTMLTGSSVLTGNLTLFSNEIRNQAGARLEVAPSGHVQLYGVINGIALGNKLGDFISFSEVGVVAENVYLGLDGLSAVNLDSRTVLGGAVLGSTGSFGTHVDSTLFIESAGAITSSYSQGLDAVYLGIDSQGYIHLNKISTTNLAIGLIAGSNSAVVDTDALGQLADLSDSSLVSGTDVIAGPQAISLIHEGDLIISTVVLSEPGLGFGLIEGVTSLDGSIFVSAANSMQIADSIHATDSGADEAQVNVYVSKTGATAVDISIINNSIIQVSDDLNSGTVNHVGTDAALIPGAGTNLVIVQESGGIGNQSVQLEYGNIGEQGYRVGVIWDAAKFGVDSNGDGIISPSEVINPSKNPNLYLDYNGLPSPVSSEEFSDFNSFATTPINQEMPIGFEGAASGAVFDKVGPYSIIDFTSRDTPVVLSTAVVRNDQNINLFVGDSTEVDNSLNEKMMTWEAQFAVATVGYIPEMSNPEMPQLEFAVEEDVVFASNDMVVINEMDMGSTTFRIEEDELFYVLVKVSPEDIQEVGGELRLTNPSLELEGVKGSEARISSDEGGNDVEEIIQQIEQDPNAEAGYWYKVYQKNGNQMRLLFYHLKIGKEATTDDGTDANGADQDLPSQKYDLNDNSDLRSSILPIDGGSEDEVQASGNDEITEDLSRMPEEPDSLKGSLSAKSDEHESTQDAIQKSEIGMTPAATLLAALAIKQSRQKKNKSAVAADINQVESGPSFSRMDRLKRKFKRSISRNAG
ncbi:MAG: hypothetical protein GY748_07055, partial [Planctomycetaceae bacterium]|nr:hypothetical protein [Planctomycetaceae bacterium]